MMHRSSKFVSATLLVGLSSIAVAQQGSSPRTFFDSTNAALSTQDISRLAPAAGTAMRPLTVSQNADSLKAYLAVADASTTFPADASTKAANDTLRRVLNEPSVLSAQMVSFDLGRLQASAAADVPATLCNGPEPYCSRIRARRLEERPGGIQRVITTLGGVAGKPHGQAIFINEQGSVHGVLNVGGRTFLMRGVSRGVFVITTTKPQEMERSQDDVLDKEPQADKAGRSSKYDPSVKTIDTCANPETTQLLDVVSVWTEKANAEALNAGYDMRQLVRTGEAIANTSFYNSNVNGEIRVLLGGKTKYVETGDMYADVQELLRHGGKLQDVRDARKTTKADVAVLIVDHPDPGVCGIAAGINVIKEKAFAVVNWKCVTDKFSFIHEIGHLAGAWHDPASVGRGAKVQPPYAYGYVTTGKEPIATIMAYRESCPVKCGRGWYWSNPFTKTEDGQVLGTTERNFDACVWRERLPTMVNFDGG